MGMYHKAFQQTRGIGRALWGWPFCEKKHQKATKGNGKKKNSEKTHPIRGEIAGTWEKIWVGIWFLLRRGGGSEEAKTKQQINNGIGNEGEI